jgi:hypothetical protein
MWPAVEGSEVRRDICLIWGTMDGHEGMQEDEEWYEGDMTGTRGTRKEIGDRANKSRHCSVSTMCRH